MFVPQISMQILATHAPQVSSVTRNVGLDSGMKQHQGLVVQNLESLSHLFD